MHISRQQGRQLSGVSIKNQLNLSITDIKNCMSMFLCINYILSNPCFLFVYLQLIKVLSTAAGPTASSGDKDFDDGTAEVVQVISAEQAGCESVCPASSPPALLWL